MADYLVGDWNNRDETTATNGHWGKRNDFNHAGPEVCWDSTGQMQPLAFQGMTDEEKNVSFLPDSFRFASPLLTRLI